jgi:hypothetical protein
LSRARQTCRIHYNISIGRREGERERERERETETETKRERETHTHTRTHRQRERECSIGLDEKVLHACLDINHTFIIELGLFYKNCC